MFHVFSVWSFHYQSTSDNQLTLGLFGWELFINTVCLQIKTEIGFRRAINNVFFCCYCFFFSSFSCFDAANILFARISWRAKIPWLKIVARWIYETNIMSIRNHTIKCGHILVRTRVHFNCFKISYWACILAINRIVEWCSLLTKLFARFLQMIVLLLKYYLNTAMHEWERTTSIQHIVTAIDWWG